MIKEKSLSSIIKILRTDIIEIRGKKNNFFSKFSDLDKADKDSICFCKYKDRKSIKLLEKTKAAIVLCLFNIDLPRRDDITFILVDNPRLSYAKLLSEYCKEKLEFRIYPTAIIGKNCKIGRVSIGPHVVIGNNVKIGDNSIIFPNVVISNNVVIGKNVVIKSNTTIGQQGFGFELDKKHIPIRIPHIGSVLVRDDVEIGANSTVCCGTLSNTVISNSVKIDDQVFIAHNVFIGPRTMIAACAEISGSVQIGSDCWLSPNCSIRDHITIGNKVLVGLGAVVTKVLPDKVVVIGNPAKIFKKNEM